MLPTVMGGTLASMRCSGSSARHCVDTPWSAVPQVPSPRLEHHPPTAPTQATCSQLTAHISRDQSLLGHSLLAVVLRIDIQTDQEISPAVLPFARCRVQCCPSSTHCRSGNPALIISPPQRSADAITLAERRRPSRPRSRHHTPDEQHGNQQSTRHLPVSNTSIIKLIYSSPSCFRGADGATTDADTMDI